MPVNWEKFEVGTRVRLIARPEMEGTVESIRIGGAHEPHGYLLYETSWGMRYRSEELEAVSETPDDALVGQLGVSIAEARYMADIDGYGDEGAGYNWATVARELLKEYTITPKETA